MPNGLFPPKKNDNGGGGGRGRLRFGGGGGGFGRGVVVVVVTGIGVKFFCLLKKDSTICTASGLFKKAETIFSSTSGGPLKTCLFDLLTLFKRA